jgi:hypothetical protein
MKPNHAMPSFVAQPRDYARQASQPLSRRTFLRNVARSSKFGARLGTQSGGRSCYAPC